LELVVDLVPVSQGFAFKTVADELFCLGISQSAFASVVCGDRVELTITVIATTVFRVSPKTISRDKLVIKAAVMEVSKIDMRKKSKGSKTTLPKKRDKKVAKA